MLGKCSSSIRASAVGDRKQRARVIVIQHQFANGESRLVTVLVLPATDFGGKMSLPDQLRPRIASCVPYISISLLQYNDHQESVPYRGIL